MAERLLQEDGQLDVAGVSADAAFSVLSRVSQAENTKLAEVARRFVETRDLPSGPGPDNAVVMP